MVRQISCAVGLLYFALITIQLADAKQMPKDTEDWTAIYEGPSEEHGPVKIRVQHTGTKPEQIVVTSYQPNTTDVLDDGKVVLRQSAYLSDATMGTAFFYWRTSEKGKQALEKVRFRLRPKPQVGVETTANLVFGQVMVARYAPSDSAKKLLTRELGFIQLKNIREWIPDAAPEDMPEPNPESWEIDGAYMPANPRYQTPEKVEGADMLVEHVMFDTAGLGTAKPAGTTADYHMDTWFYLCYAKGGETLPRRHLLGVLCWKFRVKVVLIGYVQPDWIHAGDVPEYNVKNLPKEGDRVNRYKHLTKEWRPEDPEPYYRYWASEWPED